MFATVTQGPMAGELVRIPVNPAIQLYEAPLPHHLRGLSYTATGYGKKIPTRWKVRVFGNRWNRVYCACYSNTGTLYIVHKGERVIVRW